MREFYRKNRIVIQKTIFLMFFLLGVYFFINYLFSYIAPFAFGYLIALMLEPLIGFLHRKYKIHRGLSGLFSIIIVILILAVLGTAIISRIFSEAKSFAENIPQYIGEWQRLFNDVRDRFRQYVEIIPNGFNKTFDDAIGGIATNLTSVLGSGVGQGSINIVRNLPSVLLAFFLSIISAFFFIKDKQLVDKNIRNIMPKWIRRNFGNLRSGIFEAFIGYIKAQLIIMSVSGTICILGLTIMKYPYALLIGLILAFLDFLPIFGVGTVLWPWALYTVLGGNYRSAVGLVIIYAVVFVTRQFLEPKVLSSQIGIHPLFTLMSIYIGMKIFGVLGFFIGPFVVVSIKIILESSVDLIPKEVDFEDIIMEDEVILSEDLSEKQTSDSKA